MKATEQRRLNRFAKPLALVLAVFSFVFFLEVTTHGHEDGRQDPACRICQIAHLGIGLAVTAVALNVPFTPVGAVAVTALQCEIESFGSYACSRAPPTSTR